MPSSTLQPELFAARRERLNRALDKTGLRAILVTDANNVAYLTGFRGSAGVALFSISQAFLWVDPRYTLQARRDAHQIETIEVQHGLLRAAGTMVRKICPAKLGYDDVHLPARDFFGIQKQTGSKVKLVTDGGLIPSLREIKDPQEVTAIREAGRITAEAFTETIPQIKPGIRETELAAEIEYRMRRKGAEGTAFESIVASGPRSAYPHARASRKSLEESDLVIIDIGAIIDGYAADMTRTLYLGKAGKRVRNLFDGVSEAQQRGIAALSAGVTASDVDSAARNALGQRQLDKYFIHSTGHGVGLDVHESPRLGRGVKARIETGNVVTIEPGVYLEGLGGIRIEDTVYVGEKGPEILTPASKSDWIVP